MGTVLDTCNDSSWQPEKINIEMMEMARIINLSSGFMVVKLRSLSGSYHRKVLG
jgi:hypothetical protein